MISEEQKELADYVKGVHLSLRRRAQEVGPEKAWQEHLQNQQVLARYADSMKKLSENYWAINNKKKSEEEFLCRNEWITNNIDEYFRKGGLKKEMMKEMRKMQSFLNKGLLIEEDMKIYDEFECEHLPQSPYKVLDVGSCHNPLKKYDFLEVYPIDLCPAIPEVKKCNFIDIEVDGSASAAWFESEKLDKIPSCHFDIVVFSLLLEYLPSPRQRFLACLNAYKCLKFNGLLLIVTPDSKHATANSRIMKTWKMAAACIGLNRIRLEKLKYLHCMAFRKSISSQYPQLLYDIRREVFEPECMFVIPQDTVEYKTDNKPSSNITETDESTRKVNFDQLPFS